MEACAYSPAHITGVFQICDEQPDPLHKGSKGAGISLDRGVFTRVIAAPAFKQSCTIKINDAPAPNACVSEYVLRRYQSMMKHNYHFIVEHRASIPVGSGFGASGAGALSLSIALNEVLGLGFSRTKAAQIAHEAEIRCKTGMGTVIAEACGGLEVRVKAGGPGIGEVMHIDSNGHRSLIALHYGPVSTPRALSNIYLRWRINKIGSRLLDYIIKDPSVGTFLSCSRMFSEHLGIMSERVGRVVKGARYYGVDCGMAMFGDVVFTLAASNEIRDVERSFRRLSPDGDILTSSINLGGARLLW